MIKFAAITSFILLFNTLFLSCNEKIKPEISPRDWDIVYQDLTRPSFFPEKNDYYIGDRWQANRRFFYLTNLLKEFGYLADDLFHNKHKSSLNKSSKYFIDRRYFVKFEKQSTQIIEKGRSLIKNLIIKHSSTNKSLKVEKIIAMIYAPSTIKSTRHLATFLEALHYYSLSALCQMQNSQFVLAETEAGINQYFSKVKMKPKERKALMAAELEQVFSYKKGKITEVSKHFTTGNLIQGKLEKYFCR